MFDEKTILARLQNGEDATKIAEEMTAALNAANKTYAAEKEAAAKKAAEEKARKEAEEKLNIQKREELDEIVRDFINWMSKYYAKSEEEAKAFVDAFTKFDMDEFVELIDSIDNLSRLTFKKPVEAKITMRPKTEKKPAVEVDNIFDSLFKTMGW